MTETKKANDINAAKENAEDYVFGLDIGTRSIVGTIGYMDSRGFHVTAMEVREHDTRAMVDGQVYDIAKISEEIREVTIKLENKTGLSLKRVCIAAAGRVLKTVTVNAKIELDEERKVNSEDVYNLQLEGALKAHRKINEGSTHASYYCVGSSPVKFYLNDYDMGNLEGHKARSIAVDLLATFLPEEVVDGLYSAVEEAGLEVANLTLEPIAAMDIAVPDQYRLLNIALVDVGAGTSDICITKDGSIIAYGMIPAAGDELTEIIAKTYMVDFTIADRIKIDAGSKKTVSFKDIMGIKQTVSSAEIKKLVAPVVDKITGDVADRIKKLNGGKSVGAVFVVGGGGKIPGFTDKLAAHLGLAKTRVAVRGKEVLERVAFDIDNFQKDSLFVTPVGICVNYYNQKNNFIYVTVNGDRVKLYDNDKLTVLDAIMQVGYPNADLFPKRGEALEYTVNNQARLARGLAGEAAVISKNGRECNMHSPIEKNDFIDIKPSTVGEPVTVKISDIPEYKSTVAFTVNGVNIVCPKYAYVNGELVNADYVIKAHDDVSMENRYTLAQLFEFMDLKLDDYDVTVNNEAADGDTVVYENFIVKYEEKEEDIPIKRPPASKKKSSADKDGESGDEANENGKETETVNTEPVELHITINEKPVVLTGKPSYIFVDIFDFYPFDLNAGKGELITDLNGSKAEFMGALSEGDVIELRWNDNRKK